MAVCHPQYGYSTAWMLRHSLLGARAGGGCESGMWPSADGYIQRGMAGLCPWLRFCVLTW